MTIGGAADSTGRVVPGGKNFFCPGPAPFPLYRIWSARGTGGPHVRPEPFRERGRLPFGLFPCDSIALLQSPRKHIAPAPGDQKLIVGQFAPCPSQCARRLLPLAFQLIPGHLCLSPGHSGERRNPLAAAGRIGLITVQILLGHVVLADLRGVNFGDIRIGRVLHAQDRFGLEGLPLLQ